MRWVVGVLVVLSVVASGAAASPVATQQDAPDAVLMHVTLGAQGDAAWRIEYRYRLDDEESEQAFESLQADIRNNTSDYREQFADRMRLTLRDAENTTGRGMALRNVTISTKRVQLPQSYGVVSYRFEWTNFAAVEGDELRAGDALAGLFLDEGTALVFAWPAGYHAAAVSPAADERGTRSVRWAGPREFGAGEPRLVLAPGTPTPTRGAMTDATGSTTAGTREAGGGGLSGLLLPAALAVGALAVVALFATRRRSGDEPATASEAPDDGDSGATAADPALLTNEEQVLGLLEERGGRVKQQTIAEELDWTDAKTSKVVRNLREEGAVEVVRLGRENVVGLPGELDT